MNVTAKFQRAIAEGEPLDWAMLCFELDAEHAGADSTRERENLLALFFIVADMVERVDTTAHTLADFHEGRRRIYERLLLREACLDGRLCAKTLNAVTEREVIRGRMLQHDPLRLSAVIGFARITQGTDNASDRQPDAAPRAAVVAGLPGGRWLQWSAWMAWLTRRSAA